jgi:hypothetical protein
MSSHRASEHAAATIADAPEPIQLAPNADPLLAAARHAVGQRGCGAPDRVALARLVGRTAGNRAVGALLMRAPGEPDDDGGGLKLDVTGDEITAEDEEAAEEYEEFFERIRLGAGPGWNEWSLWEIEFPMEAPPAMPAKLKVTPEVAFKMLENYARGEPPFRPDFGKGGCSWFTTEGSPYAGIDAAKNIPVEVEIIDTPNKLVLGEAELQRVFQRLMAETRAAAEAEFRRRAGIDPARALSSKQLKAFNRFHKTFAESRMWDRVGQLVAESEAKAAEVILENSQFSRTANGRFAVIADAAKIRFKDGAVPLIKALAEAGHGVPAGLFEAVKQAMLKLHPELELVTVLRAGGRLLIAAAITADVIKILYADDKLKATIEVAGGWATATLFAETFALWWAPADIAGPEAWVVHIVGSLAAGGIGYFVGSWYAGTLYEIVVQ